MASLLEGRVQGGAHPDELGEGTGIATLGLEIRALGPPMFAETVVLRQHSARIEVLSLIPKFFPRSHRISR
jgi:hypothetical protein